MNFVRKLDNTLLTSIITFIVAIVAFGATSFLLSSIYLDIPLGFALSGGVVAITYVITYLLSRLDEGKENAIWSIIAIIVRFILFAGSLVLLALAYYRWGVKLFNIFTYVGVYTFSVATYSLTFVIRKNRKE